MYKIISLVFFLSLNAYAMDESKEEAQVKAPRLKQTTLWQARDGSLVNDTLRPSRKNSSNWVLPDNSDRAQATIYVDGNSFKVVDRDTYYSQMFNTLEKACAFLAFLYGKK
jgi:hypothetical protein